MEIPARFEDFRPYQVRVEGQHEMFYGIVDTMPRARAEFRKGNCIVAHAVLPKSFIVPISSVTEVPLSSDPFNHPDAFDQFVAAALATAEQRSEALGDRFAPGRLFSVGVADGAAWYVVTKVGKTNCTIEWRGFCADRYTDQVLGWGGSFPRRAIEPLARCHHGLRGIFAGA